MILGYLCVPAQCHFSQAWGTQRQTRPHSGKLSNLRALPGRRAGTGHSWVQSTERHHFPMSACPDPREYLQANCKQQSVGSRIWTVPPTASNHCHIIVIIVISSSGSGSIKMLPGCLVAQVVEHLPLAQVVISQSWDRVPHRAPHSAGSLPLSLPLTLVHALSLSLSLSLSNK